MGTSWRYVFNLRAYVVLFYYVPNQNKVFLSYPHLYWMYKFSAEQVLWMLFLVLV
jgi:hypothetical protein